MDSLFIRTEQIFSQPCLDMCAVWLDHSKWKFGEIKIFVQHNVCCKRNWSSRFAHFCPYLNNYYFQVFFSRMLINANILKYAVTICTVCWSYCACSCTATCHGACMGSCASTFCWANINAHVACCESVDIMSIQSESEQAARKITYCLIKYLNKNLQLLG